MPAPQRTLNDLATQLETLQGSVNMVYAKVSRLESEPPPELATVQFRAVIPAGQVFAFRIEDGHAILARRLALIPVNDGLVIDKIVTLDGAQEILGEARPRPQTGELNTLPPDFRFAGKLMRPGDHVIVRNPTDRDIDTTMLIGGTLETPTQQAGRLEYENRQLRMQLRTEQENLLSTKVQVNELAEELREEREREESVQRERNERTETAPLS